MTSAGQGAYAEGATRVSPGTHHLAGTYDGTALRVYLDGEPDTAGGPLNATGNLGVYNATDGLGVGGGFVDGAGFRGTIDEAAVYDSALSHERIRAHYEAAK
jgi:hypothetical protein